MAPQVSIRLAEPEDAPGLADLLLANRAFLTPFGTVPQEDLTPARQAELIRERRDDAASWPGVITVDGQLAGRMNLQHIVRWTLQSATVGYWVGEEFGGRGVATTALRRLIGVGFGDLDLHRLDAGTLVDNARSQKVLQACGFEEIGLAREYLLINGEWRDHLLFQLIAKG